VGPFDYDFINGSRPNLAMQIKRYDTAEVFAFNKSYYFSHHITTGIECVLSVGAHVFSVCVCVSVCVSVCLCTHFFEFAVYPAYVFVSNCPLNHTEKIPLYKRNISCTGERSLPCTNSSIPCCSMSCCNHTVQEQVENYVNEKKLDG